VLDDHKRCVSFKLANQVNRSIDIYQIIVGKLLAIELVKQPIEISEVRSFLMRVFAIAENATFPIALLKGWELEFLVEV
jgi:hypothetical protein